VLFSKILAVQPVKIPTAVILSETGAPIARGFRVMGWRSEGSMHFRRQRKVPMRLHERRHYYVYILTNRSKTLYVGVTGNLHRRVWQHKQGHGSDFCSRYKIDRLVYYGGAPGLAPFETWDSLVVRANFEKHSCCNSFEVQ
jgi:GIY-YIG catalytic domain-containing protein